jgi:uncharacterized membrane protein YbhN (UPF0104 family)
VTSSRIDLGRLLRAVVLAAGAWAAILLAAMAWWAGPPLREAAARVGGDLLALTVAMFVVNHGLRFLRWHWMLRLGGHRVAWPRSFAVFMAGIALVPTPGKVGVAVRSLLLRHDGVPVSRSLALYFSERLLDFIGLVALATLLVAGPAARQWAVALATAFAGVVAVQAAPWLCASLSRRVSPGSRARRGLDWLAVFLGHSAGLLRGWRIVPFLLMGVAANLATAAVLFAAMERAAEPIAAAQSAAIVAIAHLTGSLSLLPGGLGGFEAAMLAALAASGAGVAASLVALVLVRLVTVWLGVATGLPFLWREVRRDSAPG